MKIKKSHILASIATAVMLSSGFANAEEVVDMEKCHVIKNGKGMIKEHKGDCGTSRYSCGGQNPSGDPEAWIMVPKGECEKIKKGDLSGIPESIKEKIEPMYLEVDTK